MAGNSNLGNKENPIKIDLKPGATVEDLAKELNKHHKTIADLHAQSQNVHVFLQGKQIPGDNIILPPSNVQPNKNFPGGGG
jgi:hypothetical protein